MTVKRSRAGKSGWQYRVDGDRVPGVTKVTGMLPKDNLIDWAAKESANHAVNYWDELSRLPLMDRWSRIKGARYNRSGPAAKRGTDVHRYAEQLANDDLNWDQVPEDHRGYVEAYQDFLETFDVRPLVGGTELVVASREHRYCGSTDLVADLSAVETDVRVIPASRWLLDIKTSDSGIWPETALQVCGYARAEVFVDPAAPDDERLVSWLEIAQCGAVHLASDAWSLYPLDTGPQVWEAFLKLRWLLEVQEDMKSWVGAPAKVPAALTTA